MAQQNGHTGPAPVVQFGANGHIRLSVAVGRNAGFLQVAGHCYATDFAIAVTRAHAHRTNLPCARHTQAAQQRHLLCTHHVSVHRPGWLHCHQREHLQHVVLQHVAQCAGAVVVLAAAAFHAQFFGHRDLYQLNVLTIPHRLEDGVVEAKTEQVLHGFFAQVMVDAEDLEFAEALMQIGVECLRRRQVVAERLLDHHAAKRLVVLLR